MTGDHRFLDYVIDLTERETLCIISGNCKPQVKDSGDGWPSQKQLMDNPINRFY